MKTPRVEYYGRKHARSLLPRPVYLYVPIIAGGTCILNRSHQTPALHPLILFYVSIFMKEFGMKLKKPLVILEDNQSTVSLCYNKFQNQRSKHIDVRYFYIRHLIRIGLVQVKWIPSEYNTADWEQNLLVRYCFGGMLKLCLVNKQ
jgi:hypothetical protein